MPRLSAWSIRLSLLYLLFGFSLGALMLANIGEPFAPWAWTFLPVHIETLIFGFIVQFAFAVGYWILPRHRGGLRGVEWMVWVSFGLLNLGIWMVSGAAWLNRPGGWQALGHLLEAIAAILFVSQAWRRIRAS